MGANLLDHELKKKPHDWLDFDAQNFYFLKNLFKEVGWSFVRTMNPKSHDSSTNFLSRSFFSEINYSF